MKRLLLLTITLILVTTPVSPSQQVKETKILVKVSHFGDDSLGKEFAAAVSRTLAKSDKYTMRDSPPHGKRLEYVIQVATVSATGDADISAASVVIQEENAPDSWPVPYMWYHKVFLVRRGKLDEIAATFVADMEIHRCNLIRSAGPCAKEPIPPSI